MSQPRKTIEDLLRDARGRITRYEPEAAAGALARGALLIDLRSDDERSRDGTIPGSMHVPRSVLEWRLDPNSRFANPAVGGIDREVIVFCAHGYSSSLAAASLRELGFANAGDIVGGFEAWRAGGLPVRPAGPGPALGELPGMRPPE